MKALVFSSPPVIPDLQDPGSPGSPGSPQVGRFVPGENWKKLGWKDGKSPWLYGHLSVITGYKWDYTFYKWG